MLGDAPLSLVSALKRVLRPLIRLLLSHQITYPMLIRLLKSLYVEVANLEFRVAGKEQTDSRISLLTGVHRKDIKRLRSHRSPRYKSSAAVSLGAQLVALWTGDSKYLDNRGKPRPLPRLPRAGEMDSFEELVSSVNTDIRPRVVLDEWLRLGMARLDKDDRVSLIVDAFIPEKGFDEKAFYFGQNIHDHLSACAHNLLNQRPPMMEHGVFSDALSGQSLAELTELAHEKSMEALQAVSRRAMELERTDASAPPPKHRINFGIYVYFDPVHKSNAAYDEDRG